MTRFNRIARTARKARALLAGLALTAAAPAAAQGIETATLTVGADWTQANDVGAIQLVQPIGRAGALPTFPRFDYAGGFRLQSIQGDPATAETVDVVTFTQYPRDLGLPVAAGQVFVSGYQYVGLPDLGDQEPVIFTQTWGDSRDPVQVRITSRSSSNFGIEPAWFGGGFYEEVGYLAIARGTHELPDGGVLIVGRATIEPGASEVRVELPTALFDDAATITALEGWSTQSTVRVDELGAEGEVDALSLRLEWADGTPSTEGATIGYMVVGQRAVDPAVTLLSADSGASIDYTTEGNGRCHALADYGLADALEAIELVGPGRGRASLALYDRADCGGVPTYVDARGSSTTQWVHADAGPSGAQAFRVLHRAADTLSAGACVGRGEMMLDNGFATFGVDASGRYGLFHRDPVDGALVADTVLAQDVDRLCGMMDYVGLAAYDSGGQRVWFSVYDYNNPYTPFGYYPRERVRGITLDEDCAVGMVELGGEVTPIAGGDGCFAQLPIPMPSLGLSFEIIFGDIDGDGDPEMVLMVENGDGTGYLMTDPLGIADMLTTLGYPVDDDFYDALSVTQQATLQQQTQAVYDGGARTGDDVRDLVDLMHLSNPWAPPALSTFGITPFNAKLDVAIGGDAQALGPIDGRVRVGRFQFELDVADNGIGASLAITASEIEFTYQGYATATFRGGAVYGTVASYDNAIAVGAGADAVSVTLTGGRSDRSHVAVTAAAGTSFWAEARAGRNDQYGFSLALPICPISIAIYVKGEDAVWVANETARLASEGWGYAQEGYHETAEFATNAWMVSRDWTVNAAGDTRVFFEDTARDTRVFAEKSYASAVVVVESGAQQAAQFFTGAGYEIAAGFDQTTQAVSDGFMSAAYDAGALAESVGGDIAAWGEGAWNDGSNWAQGAANDVGNWVQGAANDVANFFGGLF